MKIAIDCDNTLHPWYWLARREARKLGFEIPEAPKEYRFWDNNKELNQIVDACFTNSNILSAIPYPGSVWALKKLNDMGHTLDVVTSRHQRCFDATAAWLGNYYSGLIDHLYCVQGGKADCFKDRDYDIVIDDKPETLLMALGQGRKAITLVHPWNIDLIRKSARIAGVYNWIDMLQVMKQREWI